MKHHIAVKFLAVLLCALTLMGAVGSAVGIFVMTELDLYAKTVEQIKEERLTGSAEAFASNAAVYYASETLGGCPEGFLDEYFGYVRYAYYNPDQYAYTIQDAEGTVLYSYGTPMEDATVLSVPVTGKYLHLISLETAEERSNREKAAVYSYSANFTIGEDTRILDALPAEGRHVAFASMCDAEGKVLYERYDAEGIGFLHYNKNGRVTFDASRPLEDEDLAGRVVSGVHFVSLDGTVLYEATAQEGVGVLSVGKDGQLVFTEGTDVSAAAAAEAPVPAETEEETEPAGVFPIFYVTFLNEADEVIYEAYSELSVGFLTRAETGRAQYRGYLPEEERLPEDVLITDAYFYSYNEGLLYHASNPEGVGTVSYTGDGQLLFLSYELDPVFDLEALKEKEPEETEPEETEAEEEDTEDAEATEETSAEEDREDKEPSSASGIPEETVIPAEPSGLINGKPLEEYQQETSEYYDSQLENHIYVNYVRATMPDLTVVLYLAPNALGMESEYQLLALLKACSGYLFPALAICLLLFAVCAVYLCCTAGRTAGSDEIRAGGLNRLPLDLYFLADVFVVAAAVAVGAELGIDRLSQNLIFSTVLVIAMAFVVSLTVVAFAYAVAAQMKVPGGYWWRNTVTMRFMFLFFRFAGWLESFLGGKGFPWLKRALKWTWRVLVAGVLGAFRLWERFAVWFVKTVKRLCRWLFDRLSRFFSLIPMTWQWILAGFSALLFVFITVAGRFDMGIVLSILYTTGLILYASHCFGLLAENTKRMGKGDLDAKVEDKLLVGCFKEFADDLNDLADVAVVAAQKQLKSERMKTELITNVSHDIKTPLTSIINYVDLLQKPHTDEEQEQYLEVLDRQSLRLKKLIDDLMDMSKASTGNMAVEVTTIDAVESVNQALGEFSDKLAAAQLTPMFRHAENRVSMRADGKLVWRVLSNLLSNAVKYAMPGTRLYIDLMELEGKVIISLKNISRQELNVDAEELMERFVRGDGSRNTEGSGLGLNIAKSLMELQKGQLQLLVDGDLFKVTLIFPGL